VIKHRPTLRVLLAALFVASAATHAQAQKKNPTSKLYVADISGDAQIDRGAEIDDLTKKSVFNAQGSTLETKASSNAAVVLSNGTGLYVDTNTTVVIKSFEQEAFRPNRTDIEDEPSISTTHLYIEHGVLGVSTSKQSAGSTVEYDTSLASASIRGRQAVIVAEDNLTVISMVQGEATVQAGPLARPLLVKNHQQIIVHPGNPGEANIVDIQDIPEGNSENSMDWLEFRVLTADSARKVVYFEVQARKAADQDGSITVFDGATTASTTTASSGSSGSGSGADGGSSDNNEIVAVPVTPAQPPIDTNVSPANLTGH
jgi:hypothetical protein